MMTKEATKHLTPEQRTQLRELVDQCDLRELLLAVAGMASHDIEDYEQALDCGDLIRKAANVIR
jgi:hypothetical protein